MKSEEKHFSQEAVTHRHCDKLRKRRNEVITTLQFLQNEQCIVDKNKDWIDKAAYESRCRLLSSLDAWYAEETARINAALKRINEGEYGICLGCREAIDARRLETAPEIAFCSDCEKREKN